MADRFRSSIIELGAALSTEWNRFWFTPAPARRLAVVRSLAGGLGLLLAWSWAGDLIAWFGPDGIVSPEVLTAWRSPTGLSLFDAARLCTPAAAASYARHAHKDARRNQSKR